MSKDQRPKSGRLVATGDSRITPRGLAFNTSTQVSLFKFGSYSPRGHGRRQVAPKSLATDIN